MGLYQFLKKQYDDASRTVGSFISAPQRMGTQFGKQIQNIKPFNQRTSARNPNPIISRPVQQNILKQVPQPAKDLINFTLNPNPVARAKTARDFFIAPAIRGGLTGIEEATKPGIGMITGKNRGLVSLAFNRPEKSQVLVNPDINPVLKGIMGDEPMYSLEGVSRETTKTAQQFGVPKPIAKTIGPLGAVVGLGMDLTIGGGKDDIAKAIAKSSNLRTVTTLANKAGITDPSVLKRLVKETDYKKIGNNLSQPTGVKGGVDIGANKNVASRSKVALTGQKSLSQAEITTKLPQTPKQSVSLPLKQGVPQSNLKVTPSSTDIIPQNDPVKKIVSALTEAKPLRSQTEALYSKERSKRIAQVIQAGKVGGERGYFTQLSKLKGELPKKQFESIRNQISQPDIDSLFNSVEKANILPFEKINAKAGLSKLLGAEGGAVPNRTELRLLSEIFPKDFISAVMGKRPFMEKMWSGVENALNLPRAIMATADLSAPLRQGVLMIGRPKQFVPAFKDMFKYAFSEKAYQGFADSVKLRPTYLKMRQGGLQITDMGTILNKREEMFMSDLAEKIPIFGKIARGSNRAYSGFLNKLRADTFDDIYLKAKGLGIADDKVTKDIARFVNTATGRGGLGKLEDTAAVLNGVFFSPRLMSSRLNTLNPLYYTSLSPIVRKEALKSLLTFGAVAGSILGLSKLGGADVGTDPRSADFGKIKVGDTRFDPWGGFQQYIVLASRLATGEMVSSTTGKEFKLGTGYKPTTRADIIQRFFESKEAPIASFVTALVKGQTALGEAVNIPAEVIDRFIPMLAQDTYDLYKEYGGQGLFMAVPGAFGVGSQTYTDQIPVKAKTPTGRETIKWRSAPGIGEAIVNKVTGTQITDIPANEQQKLRDERLKETMRKIDIDKLKTKVLETGKPETYENTLIYMDNGVVKMKDVTPKESKAKKPKALKTKKKSTRKLKGRKVKAPKKITLRGIKTRSIKAPATKTVTLKNVAPKGGKNVSRGIKRGNRAIGNRSLYRA